MAAGLLAFCLGGANVMTITAASDPVVMPIPVSAAKAALQSGTTVTEYPIPTANSGASNVTVALDGKFWFTETSANQIGNVTTAGVFKEFSLPTANSQPFGIVQGPDANLWFTEQGTNKIGTMSLDGALVAEYPIPTTACQPGGIANGSDGALWFTEISGNKIGRITTSGTITEVAVPTANSSPFSITLGSDGNLWFTERSASKIGRITVSAAVSEVAIAAGINEFATPTPGSSSPRYRPSLGISGIDEFATLTPGSSPEGITSLLGGDIYFSEPQADRLGSISILGNVSGISLFQGTHPRGVAGGTNGIIYASLAGTNQILKFLPPGTFLDIAIPGASGALAFLEDKEQLIAFLVGFETPSNKVVIVQESNSASQIDFSKTGPSDPVGVGDKAIYTFTIKNNSPFVMSFRISDVVDQVFAKEVLKTSIQSGGWHSFLNSDENNDSERTSVNTDDAFIILAGAERQIQVGFDAIRAGTVKNTAFLNFNGSDFVKSKEVTTSVNAASGFTVSVDQALKNIGKGQSAGFSINLNLPQAPNPQSVGISDAQTVNLSASVIPATNSITTSFSPNPVNVPGSTTLNVSTTSSTPEGTYTITIRGTAGSVTHVQAVTLVVSAAPVPDFTLGFDQPTVTAQAGTKARVVVNINRTGGFTESVTVTPPPKANGIKSKPPDPISTTDSSAVFKMKVAGDVPPGQYPLTFTATDAGNRTRTGTVTLVVQ
jgi:virginiamycin B lyase